MGQSRQRLWVWIVHKRMFEDDLPTSSIVTSTRLQTPQLLGYEPRWPWYEWCVWICNSFELICLVFLRYIALRIRDRCVSPCIIFTVIITNTTLIRFLRLSSEDSDFIRCGSQVSILACTSMLQFDWWTWSQKCWLRVSSFTHTYHRMPPIRLSYGDRIESADLLLNLRRQ